MGKLIDETGKRYGRGVVIERSGTTRQRAARWRLLCDCGTEYETNGITLRNGRTRSCGCLQRDAVRKNVLLPTGESDRRRRIQSYKNSARVKNLEWGLTDREATDLLSGDCTYCGAPPGVDEARKTYGLNGVFPCTGIDRRDNKVGYVPENCVSCCKTCNYAKRAMGAEEFIAWAESVHEHQEEWSPDSAFLRGSIVQRHSGNYQQAPA